MLSISFKFDIKKNTCSYKLINYYFGKKKVKSEENSELKQCNNHLSLLKEHMKEFFI